MNHTSLLAFLQHSKAQPDVMRVLSAFERQYQQPVMLLLLIGWLCRQGKHLEAAQMAVVRDKIVADGLPLRDGDNPDEPPGKAVQALEKLGLSLAVDNQARQQGLDAALLTALPDIGFCEGQSRLLGELVVTWRW